MKGVKVASGIFAILEGIVAMLAGVGVILIGAMPDKIPFLDFVLDFMSSLFAGLGDIWQTIVIVAGAVVFIIALIFFIFGIRACMGRTGKGTMVTLLIFSIFMCNPIVLILSIIYLANGDEQNNQSFDNTY